MNPVSGANSTARARVSASMVPQTLAAITHPFCGRASWRRTICGGQRRSYADRRAGNWNKLSFCWGMSRSCDRTISWVGQDLKNAVNDALVLSWSVDVELHLRDPP